jgi:hypothetical protein
MILILEVVLLLLLLNEICISNGYINTKSISRKISSIALKSSIDDLGQKIKGISLSSPPP